MSEQTPTNLSNADFTFKDKYGNTGSNKGISTDDGTKLNNMVKLINLMLNTPNSTDFINTLATKQYVDENQSSGLIPNQIIQSPVPLTDANLHLFDGALLSGSGAYADYVTMMSKLYNADPTATCWTDEATWQASVTQYGECGKFVYDSVNNTLRLPKLTSFVQATSTANELGSLVEAGAPNITGVIKNNYGGTGTGNIPTGGWQQGTNGSLADANNVATGALSDLNGNQGGSYNPPYVGATAGFSFDASRSNSIYGNSNTVQPQAIKYYFYIVLGTVSKTQIQIDIDNVMADLALKADTDLSNVPSSKGILVESYVNGASWYRVYSDGWCEQGGYATASGSNASVTYLKAFNSTDYTLTFGIISNVTNNCYLAHVGEYANTTHASSTGFTALAFSQKAFNWMACGYIS